MDLTQKDDNGSTWLHFAALANQTNFIQFYLEKHVNLLPINNQKQTPIHLASQNGSLEFLETFIRLLDKKISAKELGRPDTNGQTPLMMSCMLDDLKILNFLLKQNVNVNHQDDANGDSILHLLVKHKHNKALAFVLKWNAIENKLDIDLKNKQGRTALHCAADSCFEEAVYYLCSFDSYTKVLDNEKRTPLQLAILSKCHIDAKKRTILALLKCGADYSEAKQFCVNNFTDAAFSPNGVISNYENVNGPFDSSEQLNKIHLSKITNLVFQGGSVKGELI